MFLLDWDTSPLKSGSTVFRATYVEAVPEWLNEWLHYSMAIIGLTSGMNT